MEDRIIIDEVVTEEVRAKIKAAVKEELSSEDGVQLVKDMSMATEIASMAADGESGWSRRAVRKAQLHAFKMAKRNRRKGLHVQHPQKKGRYDKLAVAYYGAVGNLKMNVKKAVEYTDPDFNEMETHSAL